MKKVSLLILSLFISFSEISAGEKNLRKSTSKNSTKRNTNKAGKNTAATGSVTNTNSEKKQNSENEKKNSDVKETLSSSVCDSEYTRCMNKICTNPTLGKCVCYENRTLNNQSPVFIDIDGLKMKQGFETFEYAKKQCVQILDKCMDSRRSITEKYKNLVQRDCLMLSKEEVSKPTELSGDLKELKTCLKNACSIMSLEGFEDFSFPEYSLCFNETYAKFSIDAFCSGVVAKSSSPLGLKQLFLDEMALKKEQSCKSMGGTLSNDRKNCYVTVAYGINKENIKASKKVAVGEYLECSASAFGVKQNETWEKKQNDKNRILSLTATAFNTAGAVLGVAGATDPIGKLVTSGINIAEASANLGFDIKDFADGKIDAANFTVNTLNAALNIGLSAVNFADDISNIGDTVRGISSTAETLAGAGLDASNVVQMGSDSIAVLSGTGIQTATNILSTAGTVLSVGSKVTDAIVENQIDKEKMKEEEKDIIQKSQIDRNTGAGLVNNGDEPRMLEKGNCFLNNEWFASENEIIMLLWKN